MKNQTAADEYREIAGRFTATRRGRARRRHLEPASPVPEWTARDVVRHLVEWFPGFLAGGTGITLPQGPDVDDDPAAAWRTMSDGVQALLDDPRRRRHDAAQPAHRRDPAPRRGQPVLHRRRVHAHLGPRPRHRPGRDPRPRALRGTARRHAAARRRSCARAASTDRRSTSPTTPTCRPGCSPSSAATPADRRECRPAAPPSPRASPRGLAINRCATAAADQDGRRRLFPPVPPITSVRRERNWDRAGQVV